VALVIESLDKKKHDRKRFSCGVEVLDKFLREQAAKHQSANVSKTFVLIDDSAPDRIIGFYTLAAGSVGVERLQPSDRRKLPHYPIPTVKLARLGVSAEEQGKKYGLQLLIDVIKRCCATSTNVGVYAVEVDAKNESAKQFYLKFGFIELEGDLMTLYYPLATANKRFSL
jgi:GNAT superfamily N-acetyltransferase